MRQPTVKDVGRPPGAQVTEAAILAALQGYVHSIECPSCGHDVQRMPSPLIIDDEVVPRSDPRFGVAYCKGCGHEGRQSFKVPSAHPRGWSRVSGGHLWKAP